jgi:hypothetical protein
MGACVISSIIRFNDDLITKLKFICVINFIIKSYVLTLISIQTFFRITRYNADAHNVRKLGNFLYILIPEIINMFMTNMSDPVRAKHVLVFKLNLK